MARAGPAVCVSRICRHRSADQGARRAVRAEAAGPEGDQETGKEKDEKRVYDEDGLYYGEQTAAPVSSS